MKKLVVSCIVLACLATFVKGQGFLKVSGTNIVNEKGENVILRGMGLGGWMLQEGYMLRLQGTNPQYAIRNRIEKLIGPEQTQQFYDAWLKNFTTRADIDSMRSWGFNSVRLPMHYNLYTLPVEQEPDSTKQTWLEKGFQLTDSLLSWCKANDMYLILDLHAAPGGQGNDLNISDRDSTKPSLWQSPANQAKTIALWKKLAERYKNEPWLGAYDIINEPNWGFEDPADRNGLKESGNKPLRELMVKITEAIRAVDKKHIIIIEGNGWGNNYKGIFPLWDDNTVISFHKYWNHNDAKSIQHMLDARKQNNAPVWVGETGENSNTWFADAVQLLESNNIGWCWWPLKKLGNNNPLEIRSNPNYNRLVDYWNGRSKTAPGEAEAKEGLMQLAAHTHNRYNAVCRDVIDALMRQPFNANTVPFVKPEATTGQWAINAVDYDLGRNGIAYYDKDTGNYRVSTGRNSAGNRGRVYRNDGVDIYRDSSDANAFYVGHIEDGEWLQYTINLQEKASYNLNLVGAAAGDTSSVDVYVDGKLLYQNIPVKPTGKATDWQTQPLGKIDLGKGPRAIRLRASKGGFNLKQLLLTKS
ncbi:MAG TPA: cellulase family glycosylhydrolase [Chitinophagaceae bacterium]|nr:cellulase family glycosylhydrolase [Chitinophagaceae bacterium]